jgi:uncharacterized membrane protein YhaH (DUF805 family)
MTPLRSKPLLIAPLIPLWAIVAFFGVEQLHRTKFLSAFVVIMLLLLATLFTYVANQALQAKRSRSRR